MKAWIETQKLRELSNGTFDSALVHYASVGLKDLIQIDLPAPPKPFEASVMVCDLGYICQISQEHRGSLDTCELERSRYNCRKITLIEKFND